MPSFAGVGLLRVGIDDDQAGEERARAIAEGVLVAQVGLRVRCLVDLQRALVELLRGVGAVRLAGWPVASSVMIAVFPRKLWGAREIWPVRGSRQAATGAKGSR